MVAGTPEEMGEQIGVLAVKPVAETITRTVRDTVRSQLGKRFEDFGWLAVTMAANGVSRACRIVSSRVLPTIAPVWVVTSPNWSPPAAITVLATLVAPTPSPKFHETE